MLKQQTDISFTIDFKIFKNVVHDQTNSSLIEKKEKGYCNILTNFLCK